MAPAVVVVEVARRRYGNTCDHVISTSPLLQGGSSDDVVKLTDSNFEETVIKSNDMWLVEFYAPWYVPQYNIIYCISKK